jgi:hypothetical protein
MTIAPDSVHDDPALRALLRWRIGRGVPTEALGASRVVWRLMPTRERDLWCDAWGVPRRSRTADPSNPGGSVGGSYAGLR